MRMEHWALRAGALWSVKVHVGSDRGEKLNVTVSLENHIFSLKKKDKKKIKPRSVKIPLWGL